MKLWPYISRQVVGSYTRGYIFLHLSHLPLVLQRGGHFKLFCIILLCMLSWVNWALLEMQTMWWGVSWPCCLAVLLLFTSNTFWPGSFRYSAWGEFSVFLPNLLILRHLTLDGILIQQSEAAIAYSSCNIQLIHNSHYWSLYAHCHVAVCCQSWGRNTWVEASSSL